MFIDSILIDFTSTRIICYLKPHFKLWLFASVFSGPLDLWTLWSLPFSTTYSFFLLSPLNSYIFLFGIIWSGLLWFGKGGGMVLKFPFWVKTLEMDLWPIYWSWKVRGWVVHLDFKVSSGPLLSFDIWAWDWRWTRTPGPELDQY